jgi:hypothetical protein
VAVATICMSGQYTFRKLSRFDRNNIQTTFKREKDGISRIRGGEGFRIPREGQMFLPAVAAWGTRSLVFAQGKRTQG